MPEFHQIALLIDADNTQPQKMDAVVELLSARGRMAVRRAFGNWSKDSLKAWIGITKRLSIKAEQQFDYVADKNATDMALAIAAIDLLHRGDYDTFAIVSSDSDFTPLAIYLREAGVHVIGIGKELTPAAFRNSCDEFIFLETLAPITETAPQPAPAATTPNQAPAHPNAPSLAAVHRALRALAEARGDAEGYVNSGEAGNYLQKLYPGFKIKHCGFSKFSTFFAAYPDLYQIKREGTGSALSLSFRCLAQEDDEEEDAPPTPQEMQDGAEPHASPAPEEVPPLTLEQPEEPAPPPAHPEKPTHAPARKKRAPEFLLPENAPFILKSGVPPEELHLRLNEAAELHAKEDGFTLLSLAGAYIRKKHPDFNLKLYKHPRLSGLLQAFPEHYELRRETRNGIVIVFYKCV